MPTWAETEVLKRIHRLEAGEVDLLTGCRDVVELLSSLQHEVARSQCASMLVAVVSETDDFPIGQARDAWGREALARADAELAAYLATVQGAVLQACRELSTLIRQGGTS